MQTRILLIFITLILFSPIKSTAQTFNPFYASIVSQCNTDSILANLIAFENLGVKELGTTELIDAKNWLISTYSNYGYTDIVEQDFNHFGNTGTNIIITKTGCKYPNQFIIIDGHYDTMNGPGTNDNGSGTSVILEIARLLKDIQTEYSIKFIHFSAEENGLIGSQRYVDNVVIPDNLDIKLVFNLDQVGGVDGMTNNTIVCERDEGMPISNNAQSAIMTDELAVCVELYSNLTAEISFAYSSDYMPFEENGEIITGFYEKNETSHAHSPTDLLINMDPTYVYEVCKAALGGALHFSVAHDNSASQIDETLTATVSGLNYQWLNCNDNYSQIGGAINQTYIATVNGSYAVEVTNNGCVDTSNCMNVTTISLSEIDFNSLINIYPNPTNGELHINSEISILKIEVINLLGEVVFDIEKQNSIDLSFLSNGFYQIIITTSKGRIPKRILIQK